MGKKKWLRALAIVLVIACLAGTAAAAGSNLSGLNINGDSIVNIWDAQSVLFDPDRDQLEKDQFLTGIKNTVLGLGSDEIEYNSTGDYYEINSVLDMYQMAYLGEESEGKTFVLTKDLNLEGADWKPIRNFAGIFDGNSKTISNYNITKPAADQSNTQVLNMGFFGNIKNNATVKNLHLQDFTINASKTGAHFIGGVVGSNRGTVSGCTVDGRIVDKRDTTTAVSGHSNDGTIYRGILVGRTTNSATTAEVKLGTMTVQASEDLATSSNGVSTAVTVASVMALDLVDDKDGTTYTTAAQIEERRELAAKTKFVGSGSYSGTTTLWRDTSYSTQWETEQARAERQQAADYMYKMGTIKWTPSETIQFLKKDKPTNIHSNWYVKGTTYTGIPYNGGAGSLERMLGRMQEGAYKEDGSINFNANTVYTTIEGLETGYTNSPIAAGSDAFLGFVQYMGNDCSSAIGSAWATISHSASQASSYQGFEMRTTDRMVPGGIYYTENSTPSYNTYLLNDKNQPVGKGMQPVGRYMQSIDGKETYIESGYTNVTGTKDTKKLMANLVTTDGGDDTPTVADYKAMAEYYAMTQIGDALVGSDITNESTATEILAESHDGHARMVAYDPMVIRDASNSGAIDLEQSYFITHEQGDGLFNNQTTATDPDTNTTYDTKTSSWRTNWLYTFEQLLTRWNGTDNNSALTGSDASKVTGCKKYYVPVTIEAYTSGNDSTWAQLTTSKTARTIEAPNVGKIFTHWRLISTELVIYSDEQGKNELYRETGWVNVSSIGTYSRAISTTLDLSMVHGDYAANAAKKGVDFEEGQTYYFRLELRQADGRVLPTSRIKSGTDTEGGFDMADILPFTYTAAATTTTE